MSSYGSELQIMDGDSPKKTSRTRLIVGGFLLFAVGLGVGVLIGWFGRGSCDKCQECPEAPACLEPCLGPDVPSKIIEEANEDITDEIIKMVDADNIRDNLRKWTSYPHLAGTEGEDRLALELGDMWEEQGLDEVIYQTYEILLSYPDKDNPSLIHLLDGQGDVNFTSQAEEPVLTPDQNQSDIIPPFNAYSAAGSVKGDLVYVNYARVEDFRFLTNNKSINLTDRICISRYGRIFRGDKVALAQQYGCSGLILYTDPSDYSVDEADEPYPDSWWLPGQGVQRGTVLPFDGDPLTPGYPAIDSAYRLPREEVLEALPKIPAHPIGYNDAYNLLRYLGGEVAPADWQGGLSFNYSIGPGFDTDHSDWTVQMNVTTETRMANSTNVFGYIRGSVEPDRYVLLGNHRDAWVFGAADPTSGTAVMAEVSRVMAKLVKDHEWRPRRTLVFCSWGAEEYALIGSVEFVEQYIKTLSERAVVNLNVDMTFSGNDSIRGLGVPLVYDAMYDVAHKIKTPNNQDMSLFEEWLSTFPDGDTGLPRVGQLGAGSDYAGFITVAGVPALDVRFIWDSTKWSLSSYPLYHSAYETFHLVENYIDPNFEYSQAIGRYWAEMARYMADSLILPLNVTRYGETLVKYVNDLDDGYSVIMNENNITTDNLHKAASIFLDACEKFTERLQSVNKRNPAQVRSVNDQLMQVERAFTDPEGLPDRSYYKHLIYAPSAHDAYAGATFPGLVDLMFEIEDASDAEKRWEAVKRHLATLAFTLEAAASILRPTESLV